MEILQLAMLLSSLLVFILPSSSLASLCRGGRQEFRSQIFPTRSRQTLTQQLNTSTLWIHLPRGGSTSSTPLDYQLEKNPQAQSFFKFETDICYDRYAACLAATEGLRRIRDQTLQAQQQHFINDSSFSKRKIREVKQWATAVYAENASKVIEAMGMPIEQFNALGKIVCNDVTLKQKVCILVQHRNNSVSSER